MEILFFRFIFSGLYPLKYPPLVDIPITCLVSVGRHQRAHKVPGVWEEIVVLKLVALWSPPKPEDRPAFEAAYASVHAPLARALPGLASLDTILIDEGLEGAPADFYRVAIMSWPDREAFERDQHTPEWAALRADAGQMIERFGVTLTSSVGQDG